VATEDPDELERLLGDYIDRLNAGERLDLDSILAEHPAHGPEIVEHLRSFSERTVRAEGTLGSIGDFVLQKELGRGGMGVVYEAWQRSMDRPVALKVLPAALAADQRAFLRFLREAKTAGQLHHPNIVAVHAMGQHETTPYYAMLTGQSPRTLSSS
jgi:hypothetical protein